MKREKALNIFCWVVIVFAIVYFGFQICMGVISKFNLLF